MAQYRKKPVVIEAFRYGHTEDKDIPNWFQEALRDTGITEYGIDGEKCACDISTLEGVMTANEGDWIIKGIKGEIYPCKHDIFEKSYEAV